MEVKVKERCSHWYLIYEFLSPGLHEALEALGLTGLFRGTLLGGSTEEGGVGGGDGGMRRGWIEE